MSEIWGWWEGWNEAFLFTHQAGTPLRAVVQASHTPTLALPSRQRVSALAWRAFFEDPAGRFLLKAQLVSWPPSFSCQPRC